jgi:hypothetical protein
MAAHEDAVHAPHPLPPEPRWPALVGLLAVGVLVLALPARLVPGPNWLLLVILSALAPFTIITHRLGRVRANWHLGLVSLSLITVALLWALAALIAGLSSRRDTAPDLLRSAVALWTTNVLVFALWYWKLDGGGPHKRDRRGHHREGAFQFPQMAAQGGRPWRPGFVDYLFLAFNTSTAFSPTDVAPLSRWAKVLMMMQSLVSLTTIAILAGRAVNIL